MKIEQKITQAQASLASIVERLNRETNEGLKQIEEIRSALRQTQATNSGTTSEQERNGELIQKACAAIEEIERAIIRFSSSLDSLSDPDNPTALDKLTLISSKLSMQQNIEATRNSNLNIKRGQE